MAISTPAHTQINHVATAREYSQKETFINSGARAGSYLTQATALVYDDILRFQNTIPKTNIVDGLTPGHKMSIYWAIKSRIYEPMYGVSGSPYYDESYFNYLKGFVGSYFYKQYDWFNTNDETNALEFAALNAGNALYQFIDVVASGESFKDAFTDFWEQGKGTYASLGGGNNIRPELKNEIVKVDLFNADGSSGDTVYAGFDINGTLVVWDSSSYASLGTQANIAIFDYDLFAGNVLWFMDELVGIESDWNKKASPGIAGNTAYGYVQFTEDSVATAVTRYLEHIKTFNSRKDTRDWHPWGVPKGAEMQVPHWLTKLEAAVDKQPNDKPGPGYKHEVEMDKLSYDMIIALAFVHLHSSKSRDSNFILLSTGDVTAAKEIYERNHHTNPDAATLARLNVTVQTGRDKNNNIIPGTDPGFFRLHYVPAPTILSVAKSMPLAQSVTLIYDTLVEQFFTDKYKANVTAVKAANGVP